MPVKRSPKGSGRAQPSPSGVRFEPDLLPAIARLAESEGRSRNDVINRLLRKALASTEPVPLRNWDASNLLDGLVDLADQLAVAGLKVQDLRWEAQRATKPGLFRPFHVVSKTEKAGDGENLETEIESNVDEPQDLRESEIEVVHYAAAGAGGHPEPTPTGETVLVINPIARIAIRNKWKAVKVVGDSMEPDYAEGDFVILQPVDGDTSLLKQDDTCYVFYEGELLLKRIHFKREHDGRLSNVKLESINKKRKTISVGVDDQFAVIGREEYHVKVRGRFR